MHVVATAGHVDHGKSTLVRALTGMEPDRWRAERERGLTIDLGFAWTRLPSGRRVAFVDVPGHERFVPNTLAGLGPVPAVLFVVAADGGWMPQSAEHLAALDALGVGHGLLVVTRADLADPTPARRVALERIAATTLGEIPSVVVSGVTGEGMAELRAGVDALVGRLPPADPDADVRLWVDRSFTVGGSGTVVTGTLGAGTVRAGDTLLLSSTGEQVRVRAVESLGEAVAEQRAVARVALNLRGVERSRVRRGDALLSPGVWRLTDAIDVELRGSAEAPPPRQAMLHVGSAAVPVETRPLGAAWARLRLARPLPLRFGDTALLRDPGAHRIVAGVRVLDVDPPPLRHRGAPARRAAELAAIVAGGAREAARSRLLRSGFVPVGEPRVLGLPALGEVRAGFHVAPEAWARLRSRLGSVVAAWRGHRPLEPGPPVEQVRRELGLPAPRLVTLLARECGLEVREGRVLSPDAVGDLPPRVRGSLERLARDLRRAPFAAPDTPRLAELGLGPREIAASVRAGRLMRVAEGVVLLPGAVEQAHAELSRLPQPFTVSAARRALATSRRVAVPLLELLDRRGLTRRLDADLREVVGEPGRVGTAFPRPEEASARPGPRRGPARCAPPPPGRDRGPAA
ncbi:selenocysteine-specific translation elongation factor SelB [Marinactinospora thermotolerans DSM 45154]|uniref:Selenocysteine-specific elongation factor n=1 Tax=Marinactinospora thermotolerans DSM 45154 TaxID=1122192 RepID=A0A1T4TAG4_9ACTN|nr:selenocysteine-specific translation elongation factor [Marinactinospora thermotolerans]SKA37376.1 selenocysteine-specific translation elongation factor SelB [Marinactinospora thermotolerans DSM 45154]